MTTGSDQSTPPAGTGEKKETSSGLEPKVAGLLCYLVGWVTGIVFLLIEKDNKFVRFHAIQSICVFGAYCVLQVFLYILAIVVPWPASIIFSIPSFLLFVLAVVLWVVLMYKAYQEEEWELPIAGKFAKEHR